MWNKIRIGLKKTLPAPLRRKLSVWRNRLLGVSSHDGWQEVLPEDVYLVSFPRSGNTWLRNILTNLRFPDAEWDLRSMAVAFPEVWSQVDPASVPRPRWIKSHERYNAAYPKVIYLIRDGRDVAVSYYHWSNASEFQSFGEFLQESFLPHETAIGGFGAWHRHVSDWLKHAGDHMLVINYEQMLSDRLGTIRNICAFLNLERSDKQIETAMLKSTFEKQQKDFADYKPFKKRKVGVKGGSRTWEAYFDDALLEQFWQVAGESMERSGYVKNAEKDAETANQ